MKSTLDPLPMLYDAPVAEPCPYKRGDLVVTPDGQTRRVNSIDVRVHVEVRATCSHYRPSELKFAPRPEGPTCPECGTTDPNIERTSAGFGRCFDAYECRNRIWNRTPTPAECAALLEKGRRLQDALAPEVKAMQGVASGAGPHNLWSNPARPDPEQLDPLSAAVRELGPLDLPPPNPARVAAFTGNKPRSVVESASEDVLSMGKEAVRDLAARVKRVEEERDRWLTWAARHQELHERATAAAHKRGLLEGVQQGMNKERADVVSWLRAWGATLYAEGIEKCEHVGAFTRQQSRDAVIHVGQKVGANEPRPPEEWPPGTRCRIKAVVSVTRYEETVHVDDAEALERMLEKHVAEIDRLRAIGQRPDNAVQEPEAIRLAREALLEWKVYSHFVDWPNQSGVPEILMKCINLGEAALKAIGGGSYGPPCADNPAPDPRRHGQRAFEETSRYVEHGSRLANPEPQYALGNPRRLERCAACGHEQRSHEDGACVYGAASGPGQRCACSGFANAEPARGSVRDQIAEVLRTYRVSIPGYYDSLIDKLARVLASHPETALSKPARGSAFTRAWDKIASVTNDPDTRAELYDAVKAMIDADRAQRPETTQPDECAAAIAAAADASLAAGKRIGIEASIAQLESVELHWGGPATIKQDCVKALHTLLLVLDEKDGSS